MPLLTRAEELILLAILKLNDSAYCVPILDQIEKASEEKWTLGGIYVPLHRLEKNGMVVSSLGNPTPERGGKSKRFYTLTSAGLKALEKMKRVEKAMWDGVPDILTR
ncbi:PadR family transcriptional regulator [candidate division KSB1 bacterium]